MADSTLSDTSPSSPRDAEKAALRRRARQTRDAIASPLRAALARLVAETGLPADLHPPGVIGAYHPTPREFDCLPLLARLSRDGWSLAMPVVTGDAPLLFRPWTPGAPMTRGALGIMEPASGAHVVPGVLLVPLLAFDAAGGRLGHGGGHYDRTLAALRREGTVIAIGLAFDEQEMSQVPVDAHDERLDAILTPSGARRLGR